MALGDSKNQGLLYRPQIVGLSLDTQQKDPRFIEAAISEHAASSRPEAEPDEALKLKRKSLGIKAHLPAVLGGQGT